MNITILFLASSSFYSLSPAFVNHHLALSNCNFQKFYPLLFYNQNTLNVKDTIFSKGLNGIALINEPIIKGNQITFSENFTDFNNNLIPSGEKKAVTFINCLFDSIGFSDKKNVIVIKNDMISLYITRSTFYNCYSNNGVLYLDQCRCVTITHTCSVNSKSGSDASYLNINCKDKDFFVFLYSTVITTDGYEAACDWNILCRSGDQYFRCINMTNFPKGGIQFDYSRCYSFGMTNIIGCSQNSIKLSGHNIDKNYQIENINIMANTGHKLIYLTSDNRFLCTISHSTLMNAGGGIIEKGGTGSNIELHLNNCLYFSSNNDNSFINDNSESIDFNVGHLRPHYFFTNEQYCPGNVEYNEDLAHACNADNCLDKACNHTIAFPSDVVSYKTFIDTNLQTPGPTDPFNPTNFFTESIQFTLTDKFSKSLSFTSSDKFSLSNKFSSSSRFSFSDKFSLSEKFTSSNKFSFTSEFTSSVLFSKSSMFSKSGVFSKSTYFTSSFYFTQSDDFSNSEKFTKSGLFSNSIDFTGSELFSESSDFSNTNLFSSSVEFSKSIEFTKTEIFTETGKFSESSIFSFSNNFTKSDTFSPSRNFDATDTFTPSNTFSSSSVFTGSGKFTYSFQFTKSEEFSNSIEFTRSGKFTPSDNFNATQMFMPSMTFSASDDFSKSSHFSKSNVFSNSDIFTKSFSFSESNKLSKSETFSPSKQFSDSYPFSIRQDVIININQDNSSNKRKTVGIAIGVVAGTVAIVLSLLLFIIIRRRKLHQSSDMFEDLDLINDPLTTSVTYQNELNKFDMSDDPFADDFMDHNM